MRTIFHGEGDFLKKDPLPNLIPNGNKKINSGKSIDMGGKTYYNKR